MAAGYRCRLAVELGMRCSEQQRVFQCLDLGLSNSTTGADNLKFTSSDRPEGGKVRFENHLLIRKIAPRVISPQEELASCLHFGCPIIIKTQRLNYLEWDSEFRYMTFIVMSIPRKMLNLLLQLIKVKSGGNICFKIELIADPFELFDQENRPEKNQQI